MKTFASQDGFTLVELLVTVLVIAVLTMAAMAQFGGINGAASVARDRQNAQMLASVANTAQAAGVDFVDPDGDLDRTVAAIRVGSTAARGAFAGEFFGLVMGSGEAERAKSYLRVGEGMLVYVAD